MIRPVLTGLALLLALPLAGATQELPKAKKFTNAKWYVLANVDFKPGLVDSAMKIAVEHMDPARRAAGRPVPRRLRNVAGKWDLTLIFPLPGGPSDLKYAVSPQDEKYMAALAKQEGGLKQARAVGRRWSELVLRIESSIVREDPDTAIASRTP